MGAGVVGRTAPPGAVGLIEVDLGEGLGVGETRPHAMHAWRGVPVLSPGDVVFNAFDVAPEGVAGMRSRDER